MSTRHLSELTWARQLAGELGPVERWRLRRHLRGCESCRRMDLELASERDEVEPLLEGELDRLHAVSLVSTAPSRERGRGTPRLWALAGGVAIAATVAVGTVPRLASRPTDRPDGVELVAKGSDGFELYVERAPRAAVLDARCAPGDRVMARYRTGHPYLLLLEHDGRGRVQVLFPQGGTRSARVDGSGTTPSSWILDEVLGEECFAAFFSDAPLDAADATRALRGSPSSPHLPGAHVSVQCCLKEPAP